MKNFSIVRNIIIRLGSEQFFFAFLDFHNNYFTTKINRYLDLRLAAKAKNKGIYFVHGLFGAEVTEPLKLTNQWLSAHPGEVVILDCQHFYEFTKDTHSFFVHIIKSIFRDKICPQTIRNLGNINLSWLSERKFQVIVIYRNEIAAVEKDVWPSGLWPTPWPDTVYPEVMINFLDLGLKNRNNNAGFVSQCLLTPDTTYVSKHPWGSLRKDLSITCRNAALPWIARNKPGIFGLNIVITDFVCDDDFLFSRTVVQRNSELLKYPLGDNSSQ